MKKINYKKLAGDLFAEVAGSFIASIGLYNFAVAANFPISGFSGIAVILFKLFALPIGLATIVLNIPVTIFCYKLLGRDFVLRSLRCMVIFSVFIDNVAPLFPKYQGEPLLAALCTGVFSGLGFAIIYMRGTSTAGMDFITMSVKKKIPHLSIGKIIFAFDIFIVLAGGAVYSNVDGVIYGILLSFITTTVMDKVMYGFSADKAALIITQLPKEITVAIDLQIGRGSTMIKATGGYMGNDKTVVLCACGSRQMYGIEQVVKKVDPQAFVIILESNEVIGQGFRPLIGEQS